ncbi:hypothetical protein PISMIDRAFT_11018 [Pisolithus microcarpus 441]|uniref:Uncharacterized protein n=1 Tax=Pisolithus microcarpus 441 TaxID=765257 RepID=A0A0C9YEF9_9AGAM|nr:hypothetical protein PISMIDRAFT_11018 [Pisolithus microcarpus 441]
MVVDHLEEEVRIMGECLTSASSPHHNNNSNNLLAERAELIVVVVEAMEYDQEYDQQYNDQDESSQYDDQYDEGYESYNVKVTALDINTANHFEEFKEEITPVPEYNLEPVEYIVNILQPQGVDPCTCSICLCNSANQARLRLLQSIPVYGGIQTLERTNK